MSIALVAVTAFDPSRWGLGMKILYCCSLCWQISSETEYLRSGLYLSALKFFLCVPLHTGAAVRNFRSGGPGVPGGVLPV